MKQNTEPKRYDPIKPARMSPRIKAAPSDPAQISDFFNSLLAVSIRLG
jgi:hypothetical protein